MYLHTTFKIVVEYPLVKFDVVGVITFEGSI